MSGNPGFEHPLTPLTRYLRRQLEAQREQREPEEEPAIYIVVYHEQRLETHWDQTI